MRYKYPRLNNRRFNMSLDIDYHRLALIINYQSSITYHSTFISNIKTGYSGGTSNGCVVLKFILPSNTNNL